MALKNKEYASMFFGFTSSAFADNVFNAGNESICANLKQFRKELQKKCAPDKVLTFDKAFQEFAARTENRGMQLNDMLKFALESKVFNIPPHLLVEGDGRQEEYSNLDKNQLEQDLDRQIKETEGKILACEFTKKKLENLISENDQVAQEFEEFNKENEERKEFSTALSSEVTRIVSCLEDAKTLLPAE